MTEQTLTDTVREAAAGHQPAWEWLVDRYTPMLRSIARGYRLSPADAGDVIQVTWLRLFEHLDSVRDPERVAGWLATTARREALRLLTGAAREQPTVVDADRGMPADGPGPEDAALTAEEHAAVRLAVDEIPEHCQRLLRALATEPAPSYAEISERLDMPVGSIGPTRARCLSCLRNRLRMVGMVEPAAA